MHKKTAKARAGAMNTVPRGLEQWCMSLIGLLIACYVAYVITSKLFMLLIEMTGAWVVYMLFPPLALAVYAALRSLVGIRRKEPGAPSKRRQFFSLDISQAREKLSLPAFLYGFSAVFVVFALNWLANYPGICLWPFDVTMLWSHVQTGTFDNWHSAIYMMIIWLLTRVVNRYAFVIAVQIFCFSLLCGYTAATLYAWGLRKRWVALFLLAVISARSTRTIMLYAIKDSYFTIFTLWAAVCLINAVLSDGAWLDRRANRVALGVALGLISIIRHNGVLFSLPIAVLLFALYAKKRTLACVFTGAVALAVAMGIIGPLYRAVGVTDLVEHRVYTEVINLPMAMLTSIYIANPQALDEDATALMEALATPAQWQAQPKFDSYLTLKFLKPRELMVDASYHGDMGALYGAFSEVYTERYLLAPPGKLARMFLHAVKNEPEIALKQVVKCNQVAWDPTAINYTVPDDGGFNALFSVGISAEVLDQLGITNSPQLLGEVRSTAGLPFFLAFKVPNGILDRAIRLLTPSRALQCLGINILALMLCAWFSLHRRRGWAALLLAGPSLAYCLATMTMLGTPEEYRIMHFITVITLPLIFASLGKVKENEKAQEESQGENL